MKKKLILIDDENMILESMESIFSLDYDVKCFEKPEEALAFISKNENKPDCIVCDVNMPQMSGIELIKQYRDLELPPPCKFLFFTGHGDFVSELEELKGPYAVDEICIKPDFSIIKKVKALLE